MSLAEEIEYLRVAVESARKKDADRQRVFAEKEEKREHARETLQAALTAYKNSLGPQITSARSALLEAVQVAREAFSHAFAAERKKLTRNLGPAALLSEPVVSLDRACGLDRKANAITWGCKLGSTPSYHQFVMAVTEIEQRYAQLKTPTNQ